MRVYKKYIYIYLFVIRPNCSLSLKYLFHWSPSTNPLSSSPCPSLTRWLPLIYFSHPFFFFSFSKCLSISLFSSFTSSFYSFFLFFLSCFLPSSTVARGCSGLCWDLAPLDTDKVNIWPQMSRFDHGGWDLVATSPTTKEIKISPLPSVRHFSIVSSSTRSRSYCIFVDFFFFLFLVFVCNLVDTSFMIFSQKI